MWRFLAWTIGTLVVLVCFALGSMQFRLDSLLASEWYTVTSEANGAGMVATVRSYCNVVDWDVPYLVYIHRRDEPNADASLVFSDRDSCYPRPVVQWISKTIVKIKVWPTAFPPTVERARIGDISIVYAVFTVPKHARKHA